MSLTLVPAAKRPHAQVPDIGEIIALAKHFIDLYFKDKTPDPSINLYQMRFIRLVINSSIVGSVHLIYDCMSIEYAGRRLRKREYTDTALEMFRQCALRDIPKEFATGLILMEYIVCKDIDIFDDE